jgi:hypothetical protein
MKLLFRYRALLRISGVNLKRRLLIASLVFLYFGSFGLDIRAIFLTLLVYAYVFLSPIVKARKVLALYRLRLPYNLLLFSLACKISGSVHRAIWFMYGNVEERVLKQALRRLVVRSSRGMDILNCMDDVPEPYLRDAMNSLKDVITLKWSDHPRPLLLLGSEDYRKMLLRMAHSLEARRAVLSAAFFFMPIFLTLQVSPAFRVEDVLLSLAAFILISEISLMIMLR